jgi:hypothetical protein
MLLPDDREVALTTGGAWPSWDSQMPWVETIEEYQEDGDVILLVDNTDLIDAELEEWNDSRGWNPGTGGAAGAGGNFTGGTSGTGNGSGNPIGNPASSSEAAGGCACGFQRESGSGLAILLGFGLVEILRRRRRARQS